VRSVSAANCDEPPSAQANPFQVNRKDRRR
jgi:hypothetical protein